MSKEHITTLSLLMLATALATLTIDFLRAPVLHTLEYLWVWWATGPSHYFIQP
jgi:hypothetical protein